MTDCKDINVLLARWIQWNIDREEIVGLDKDHLFLKAGGKVFRIKVEEITQIMTEKQARDFMAALPGGPL